MAIPVSTRPTKPAAARAARAAAPAREPATTDEIVAALLTEQTFAAAAKRTGLSVADLARIASVPCVLEAVRAGRRAARETHALRVARAAAGQLDNLESIANDAETPAAVRVAAGARVLSHLEALHRDDLAERIDAVEARIREALTAAPPRR